MAKWIATNEEADSLLCASIRYLYRSLDVERQELQKKSNFNAINLSLTGIRTSLFSFSLMISSVRILASKSWILSLKQVLFQKHFHLQDSPSRWSERERERERKRDTKRVFTCQIWRKRELRMSCHRVGSHHAMMVRPSYEKDIEKRAESDLCLLFTLSRRVLGSSDGMNLSCVRAGSRPYKRTIVGISDKKRHIVNLSWIIFYI
jgi:hypothetical protein